MSIRSSAPASRQDVGASLPEAPRGRFGHRADLFKTAAPAVLVGASYFAGTRIGFALTPGEMPIAVFWPPNAILLAALLLAPVRLWWTLLLAVVPAHFLAQGASGVPLSTAFGWLIGNSMEALLGATLISKMGTRPVMLHTVHGTARFLLFGFGLAPVATSFLDAAIVVGTNWGQDYWVLWITRLLSNMLAQLTIVPAIVVFGRRGTSWLRHASRRSWIEAVLLAVAVVAVSLIVFRAQSLLRTNIPALIYFPLPLLLWASMRFGPAALSASLLTISVVSINEVMHGRGPFISASVGESVLSMQVYLCMIGVPLLLLAAVMMERRQTEHSLSEMSRRLIDAQERERQRIVQELHDDVGQTLTLAGIELDRIIAQNNSHVLGSSLKKLRRQMTIVSRTIWELSHGLYPSSLKYLGLVPALTRLCTDLREETNIEVSCEISELPDPLPADVSLCLYRVAQEALQNIVRHSKARTASVRLEAYGDLLMLHIADDGVGFNQSPLPSGLGLGSIRERLKAVNGGVQIRSAPGQGTLLDAWVLLQRRASGY